MNKIPCILLVDDDETTNYVNSFVIKKSGIADEVLIALNGKMALEVIHERYGAHETRSASETPLLVLLDINMPIMDGLVFMECFDALDEAIKAKVTVIVLTTSMHPSDHEKINQFGVHGFINKPLKREDLQEILAGLCFEN